MERVEIAGRSNEWSAGRRLRDLEYADDNCLLVDDRRRVKSDLKST